MSEARLATLALLERPAPAPRLPAGLTPRQATLLAAVRAEPALNIREIAQRLGVRRTAANHHVTALARKGLLATLRQGRHLLHFPAAMPLPERRCLAALRIASVRATVAASVPRGGLSVEELAAAAGLKARTARGTVRFLRQHGLVHVEKVPGLRAPRVHLDQGTRVTWARWFDPARDHVGPRPLEQMPTSMALLGLFGLSWFGLLN